MGDDRGRERFTLRWLFDEHASLFTVLGVFGAMAVYFTRLDSPSRLQRLGLVSSLSLFLLVAGTIYRATVPDSVDRSLTDFLMDFHRSRVRLWLFVVALGGLVASVVGIVSSYLPTIRFFALCMAFFVGLASAKFLVGLIDSTNDSSPTLGVEPRALYYSLCLCRNAAYALITGLGLLAIGFLNQWISIQMIAQFQTQDLLRGVAVGFGGGLVAGGILFLLQGGGLVLLHVIFWRLREDKELEEFMNWYVENLGWGLDGDSDDSAMKVNEQK